MRANCRKAGGTMLYVTGDTHGEEGRFLYEESAFEKRAQREDCLFICGDFGFLFCNGCKENHFLDYLARKPYKILWIDGNHENFDLINEYPVESWHGGEVHVIRRTQEGEPKIIHLMRGQVFNINGKKIFTFGGAHSIDRYLRKEKLNWWPQEMPTDQEMKIAITNLQEHGNEVDYILTHTGPEDTMSILRMHCQEEKPLNNFLEWVRENVKYKHWYFGHLHQDQDLWRNQTVLWFEVRNMETNEVIE